MRNRLNLMTFGALLCLIPLSNPVFARYAAVVSVNPVTEIPLQQTRKMVGRVVSKEGGLISTEISGIVETVFVQVGEFIEHNAPIAKLNNNRLKLQQQLALAKYQISKANLITAQLNVELAEQSLARQEGLKKSAAFSKAAYEDLQNNLSQTQNTVLAVQAEVAEKQAQLEIAKLNLNLAIIKAPFSGLITQKLIQPGLYIAPGVPIVELINQTHLEIALDIPKEQLPAIESLPQLSVELPDFSVETAIFDRAISIENEISKTITIRLTPSDTLKKNLTLNQAITVITPLHQPKQVLSIHKDGILYRQNKTFVFIVENQTALLKPIETGESIDERIEIKSGLKLNDLVVIKGNERLQPGQKVKTQMATP